MRVALLALLCLAATGRADLSSAEWQHVRREAGALARKSGESARKVALIDAVAAEDSARSARLLLEIASATYDRHESLAARFEKTQADYKKLTRAIRKKHGRKARQDVFDANPKWKALRDATGQLSLDVQTEQNLLEILQVALGKRRSAAAVAVLVDLNDKAVARAHRVDEVRTGVLAALWQQPRALALEPLLAFAADPKLPHERARILDWIGRHEVHEGYDVAVAALTAPETAVARAAVAALAALGEPRCVPHLIHGRKGRRGLLAEEIDIALQTFTGQTFAGFGAGASWAAWWRDKGAAWLAAAKKPAIAAEPVVKRKKVATFYGVETPSDRIVFVLDRSGSMNNPVPQPRGPTTGPKRKDRVEGKTRLEVAKNELARSIRSLGSNVKFAVVFYSHDVHTWEKPPALMPATARNKKAAIDWFMRLNPVGSTMIFDALDTAHLFAKVGGGKSATDPKGADTIFLLSDGAPSTKGGQDLLTGPPLEAAVTRFLEANRAFRCVVHTIGVGPEHNRKLMQRLATATGGTYRAVAAR